MAGKAHITSKEAKEAKEAEEAEEAEECGSLLGLDGGVILEAKGEWPRCLAHRGAVSSAKGIALQPKNRSEVIQRGRQGDSDRFDRFHGFGEAETPQGLTADLQQELALDGVWHVLLLD